jgi:hypothetical protein
MITHFDADAVRYQGDRPVTVGDQPLTQPTVTARVAGGYWGLYAAGDDVVVVHPAGAMRGRPADVRARLEGIAGDQGRAGEERQAVRSFLPFLGGDDPGKAVDAPRSQVEAGPTPAYWLSDERNAPPASEPPSPAEQASRPGDPEGSGEPRRGAPVDPEGSGEPRGAPADPEGRQP